MWRCDYLHEDKVVATCTAESRFGAEAIAEQRAIAWVRAHNKVPNRFGTCGRALALSAKDLKIRLEECAT